MTSKEPNHNRLTAADDQSLRPTSLVGSYFHSDAARGWQGCVVAEPTPGLYLVELFGWMAGEPTDQRLVPLDDMTGWCFYDTAEWMTDAYTSRVRDRWNREHAEAKATMRVTR